MDILINTGSGYYCCDCETVCHMYEQGLCCDCGQLWETEVLDEKDYPKKWIKVKIQVYVEGEPNGKRREQD